MSQDDASSAESFAEARTDEEKGYRDGKAGCLRHGEKTYAYWIAHRKGAEDREGKSAA